MANLLGRRKEQHLPEISTGAGHGQRGDTSVSPGAGAGSGSVHPPNQVNFSLATINSQADLDALQRELGETRMFVSSLVRLDDISSASPTGAIPGKRAVSAHPRSRTATAAVAAGSGRVSVSPSGTGAGFGPSPTAPPASSRKFTHVLLPSSPASSAGSGSGALGSPAGVGGGGVGGGGGGASPRALRAWNAANSAAVHGKGGAMPPPPHSGPPSSSSSSSLGPGGSMRSPGAGSAAIERNSSSEHYFAGRGDGRAPSPALLRSVTDPSELRGFASSSSGDRGDVEDAHARIALLGERMSSMPSTSSTFGRPSAADSLAGFMHAPPQTPRGAGADADSVAPPTLIAARLKEQVHRKDREIQRLRQENVGLKRQASRAAVNIKVETDTTADTPSRQRTLSAAAHALASSGEGPAAGPSRQRSLSQCPLSEGPDTVFGAPTVLLELPPGVKAGDMHDESIVRNVLKHNRIMLREPGSAGDPFADDPTAPGGGGRGGGGLDDGGEPDQLDGDLELQDYLADVKGFDGGSAASGGAGTRRKRRTPRELWKFAIKAVRSTLRMRDQAVRKRRGTVADRMASPHIQALLDKIDLYTFDVFDLAEASADNPLVYVGIKVFQRHNLGASFGIDEAKLRLFFERIQAGYVASNTYHNAIHAADVTQSFHSYLASGGLAQHLSNRDMLAGILAAAVHDFEHPGVNNNFLVATRHEKAITYNDRSVLEQHHVAAAFRILSEDRYNIFANLETDEFKEVRATMIDMVLATDNSQHFHHLKEFVSTLKQNDGELNYNDPAHRRMLLRITLHAADISNPAKPSSVSNQWTDRVMAEFFAQGDRERALNLPISPFMDRETTSIGKCQRGFIEFLVAPLFKALSPLMVNGDVLIHTIESNRAHWASVEETEASKKKAL